jgi:acyl-CoA reductase-like NAD-dependent aldehyde dehydrogenase
MPLKVVPQASHEDPVAEVRSSFDRLREAYAREPYPTAAVREDRLDRLVRLIERHTEDFAVAIDADFAGRSRHETLLADIFPTLEGAKQARREVSKWMKAQSAPMLWLLLPAESRVEYQPLGVVAVLAPWNYPVNLALAPLAAALAAGNRVLVKPSELTPRTSDLIATLLRENFTAEEVAVVTGGADVARAITALPFDHILFTGSTRVGRDVAKAAAENLTPVTLELGGKSPALIHPDAPLDYAAERITAGKLFNAGQTCIAPDYVLLPRGKEEAFAQAFRKNVFARYPNLASNQDYTAMATPAGLARMRTLVADAAEKGARIEPVCPGPQPEGESRRLPPSLIHNPTDQMKVLQEEIFGPLLPIVSYDSLDEAIAWVNARPRPLAFYYFDDDRRRSVEVLRRVVSGGACVNETLFHFIAEELPFGGVGASGTGAYHGRTGFQTFSHAKGVYTAGLLNPVHKVMTPPYGALIDNALRFIIGGRRR